MSDKVIQFNNRKAPPQETPAPRVVVVGPISGPCHNNKRKAVLLRAEGLTGGATWLTLALPGGEAPWIMLRGDYCAVYGPAEARVRDDETGAESEPVVVGVEGEGGAAQ